MARDTLALKFIQGLPVLGVIGGVANLVYYSEIIRYAEIKYGKRYKKIGKIGLKKSR